MLSRYNVLNPLLPMWGIPVSAGPTLNQAMNRLFSDFETAFERNRAPHRAKARRPGAPVVQLRDAGEAISLQADLPGLGMEDIELSVEDTIVTLKAKAPTPRVPEGFQVIHRERNQRGVEWSFQLPYPIDAASASATLTQGRLRVSLPKAPEAKPRSIPVKAA